MAMSYRGHGYCWRSMMRIFIFACVAALVIAIGAYVVLSQFQMPVGEAFMSPSSTRI